MSKLVVVLYCIQIQYMHIDIYIYIIIIYDIRSCTD